MGTKKAQGRVEVENGGGGGDMVGDGEGVRREKLN